MRFLWQIIITILSNQTPTSEQYLGERQVTLFYFIRYFLFFYISNVIPFSHFTSENPLFHSPFPCSPTQSFLLSCPGIPLHWGIKPSQDQGSLLPLMSNKAILCYICSWSHESLHGGLFGCWFRPWEL